MNEQEVALRGGRTTAGVARVGQTVRRPVRTHSSFVHELLGHLESKEFVGAPRFRGIDASEREILTYIPGDVPEELGMFTDAQLHAAARLLRDLHDATTDCELRGDRTIVCHGDVSPCNCVFREGTPVAFIDFDAAHAGDRRDDFGYAAWLWLDLGNSELAPAYQGRRLAEFVASYGAIDSVDALPAILDAQTALAERPGTTSPGTRAWARTCRIWVAENLQVVAVANGTGPHRVNLASTPDVVLQPTPAGARMSRRG